MTDPVDDYPRMNRKIWRNEAVYDVCALPHAWAPEWQFMVVFPMNGLEIVLTSPFAFASSDAALDAGIAWMQHPEPTAWVDAPAVALALAAMGRIEKAEQARRASTHR